MAVPYLTTVGPTRHTSPTTAPEGYRAFAWRMARRSSVYCEVITLDDPDDINPHVVEELRVIAEHSTVEGRFEIFMGEWAHGDTWQVRVLKSV